MEMPSRLLFSLLFTAAVSTLILAAPGGLTDSVTESGESADYLSSPLPSPLSPTPSPSTTPRLALLTGAQCWKGLRMIEGCIWQIYDYLFAENPSQIGEVCCDAFLALPEDCWPKMFPSLPFFGPKVKDQCDTIIGQL